MSGTGRYSVEVTRWHADTNRDYAWGVYDHGCLLRRGFSSTLTQAEQDGRAWLRAHMDACEEWANGGD